MVSASLRTTISHVRREVRRCELWRAIAALALRYRVPTSFAERESVVAGGLMSYAASFSDSFRQVGTLVGRILKGANPKDLPVQQPVIPAGSPTRAAPGIVPAR
jgi:hypothetical protein